MLVGCLAISGIPPLAGFFSKDDILGRVLAAGNWHVVLWGIGVIAAGMTAFYMFRLFYLTFHGTYNGPREVYAHAHEAPQVMVVPAAILGVLSIVGGWIQIPAVSNTFDDFLQPVFTRYAAAHAGLAPLAANWLAMGIALAAALVGIGLASYMYGGAVRRPYPGLRPLYQLLFNKYYVDEIYDEIFVLPVRNGARILYSVVDREAIDGLVNGVAAATRRVSRAMSPVQSGYVRAYALSIFVGVVLVALVPMVFGIVVGGQ
jgi:NADH-quinone oxidoreductase subunit L